MRAVSIHRVAALAILAGLAFPLLPERRSDSGER
jgi:hypothetical protein